MEDNYQPFISVEEAWFWFCRAAEARVFGNMRRGNYAGEPRVCEISDIINIIKRVKRNGFLSNAHLRTMVKYGKMGCSPWRAKFGKKREKRLWEEGLSAISPTLYSKGIVR